MALGKVTEIDTAEAENTERSRLGCWGTVRNGQFRRAEAENNKNINIQAEN